MTFLHGSPKHILSNQRGMTIIEIMVVLMIIGIIATFVTINVVDRLSQSKIEATQIQIKNISNAVGLYRMTCDRYPSSEDGLASLVSAPTSGTCKNYPEAGFLNEGSDVPMDPYGNPYQYSYPGTNNAKSFDLWSMGSDGEDGTEDDIGNWKAAPKEEE
jgi:general secretion pathway protein G